MALTKGPIPPRADVKVGFACNNKCVFCAQGDKRIACGSLPIEELTGRLQRVKEGSRGLVLTGGEPTLYKRIVQLIAEARQMGYDPIQIQTNGRMLAYPQVLEKLVAAGANEFSPSLHGSTAEVHDGLTRAPGSWAQTTQGMRNVAARGIPLVTNSVITQGNYTDLPALVNLLGTFGVRHAQLAFVHPVGTAMELFDQVVPRLPEVVPYVRAAREVALRRGMRLMTEAIPYCFLRGMSDLAVEAILPATMVVDLDGRVADYSNWRMGEGKAHGEVCQRCAVRDQCEGPWREYPARFGWDEFVPLESPL